MGFIFDEDETETAYGEIEESTMFSVYTPEVQEFSEEKIPTTTNRWKITIPGIRKRTKVPKDKTEIIVFTIEDWEEEKFITPTSFRTRWRTFERPTRIITKPGPVTRVDIYPRTPKLDCDIIERTIVQTRIYKPTPETFYADDRQTTMLIRIVEFKPVVYTEKVPYVTGQQTFRPRVRIWTARQHRTTTESTEIPRLNDLVTMERPTVATNTYRYTFTGGKYEWRTRTSIIYVTWRIPGKKEIWTFPEQPVWTTDIVPRPRYTIDVITPSTVDTWSETVPDNVYYDEEKETTIKFEIMVPQSSIIYRTERPRTTVTDIIWNGSPYRKIWTPSSVYTERFTIPEKEWTKERAPPITRTFDIYEDYEETDVITPSTYRERRFTLPRKDKIEKYSVPKIETFYRTPRPGIFVQNLTRTGINFRTLPVERETYFDHLHGTTMRIEIVEQEPKPFSNRIREATTIIIQCPPQVEILTETLAPFTPETDRVPFPSHYETQTRPRPRTRSWRYTFPDKTDREVITKTTRVTDRWTVPRKTWRYTDARPSIGIFTFTPPEGGYDDRKTRTTVDRFPRTVSSVFDVRIETETTLRVDIREITEGVSESEFPQPRTKVTVLSRGPWIFTDKRTPSTFKWGRFTFPTFTWGGRRPPARTRIDRYTFPGWSYEDWRTPSTIEDFSFFPSASEIITKKPRKPSTIFKWPTRKTEREHRTRSTTRYDRYTVSERVFTDHQKYPTTKRYRHTFPPFSEYEDRPTASTEFAEYTIGPRNYTCVYPTTKNNIKKCVTYRRKHKCNAFSEWRWKGKIRICVEIRVKNKGKSIRDYIRPTKEPGNVHGPECTNPSWKDLEEDAVICIKQIGDTPCRNKSFNLVKWILEKELTVIGSYGERANKSNPAEDFPFNLKKCVTLIDESQMNQCFPGLYQVLSDIVIYRKPKVSLELQKPVPYSCLLRALKHCKLPERQALEKILEKTFRTCIKVTGPYERSICKREAVTTEAVGDSPIECTAEIVEKFATDLKKCFNSKDTEGPDKDDSVQDMVKKFQSCSTKKMPRNCVMTRWQTVEPVYDAVIVRLKKFKSDKCAKQIISSNFKRCLQDMFILVPYLDELDNTESAIKPVLQCVRSALNSCPSKVISELIRSLKILGGLKIIDAPHERYGGEDNDIGSTISSIKWSDSGVDICEHIFRVSPGAEIARPDIEDECVRIYDITGQQDADPSYYLMKTCKESEVDKWLKKLKNCVDDKSTQIGLRNPDFLTLCRVVTDLQYCLHCQGLLKCRPKHLPDFKKIFKAVLDVVKQNALSVKQKECRDKLRMENLSRCINILHKYLVLTYEPRSLDSYRNKALKCIEGAVPQCPQDVIENFLKSLDMAMLPTKENLQSLGSNGLQKCDSYGENAEGSEKYSENTSECPSGVLVRKKRDLNNLDSVKSSYNTGEYSNSGQFEITESVPEFQEWNSECSHQDYVIYFEKLTKCRDWRLAFKFPRHKDQCYLSTMKESWIAMIECLVEENSIVLSCNVTSKQQLEEFLNHVSETLNSNQPNNGTACLKSAWCYGKNPLTLNRCIDLYQQLLHTLETSPDIFFKVFNITKDVIKCLSSIWPRCPVTVTIMSLPFVYIPLGLDSAVTEDFNFTICSKSKFENFPREPQCFHNYGENKTESHQVVKDIEDCKACIKPKEAICFFNNVTDTFKVTDNDFKHLYHCLKNYKAADDCIQAVTSRARDSCLPLFYRCSESIQDGVIPKMLEYCWRFYRCLKHFHKNCPREFQDFIPDIYYDIIGLNSFFKKYLRQPFLDT